MTRIEQAQLSESIECRIDALHLSTTDAARAKASLRNAERIVDFGFAAVAAMRSSAAFIARHMKSAFISSPQH
ncbi:MAG: hypothetical protein ABI724_19170 [Betaproteobacteria bacterium]